MLLLSVKADSDNDIISIVLHLRTRLLHPQPESSTARGKESKLQKKKKKKAMTGQREEKKKRTCVQMQLLRRPHLCARSEVKPKAARSCLQAVPIPPS